MKSQMNLSDFLKESAEKFPEMDAMVFAGRRWTFRELNTRVNQLAHSLLRMGISKGEHIGLYSTSCHQCVELLFAVAKVGGILVPFNYRLKEEEAKDLLEHSEVTTLFFCERYGDLIASLSPKVSKLRRSICFERSSEDFLSYEGLLHAEDSIEPWVQAGDEDIALIIYTSGTTGFPKGVMISHSQMSIRVHTRDIDLFKLPEGGVSLLTLPLYHTGGIQGILKNVYRPMTLVIMRQFETRAFLEAVSTEKVHSCTLAPTMIKRILDFPELKQYDLSSLRRIGYGTAPMSPDLLEKAMAAFPHCTFTQGYGMTEGSATMLSVDDHVLQGPPSVYEKKLKRLYSVGRAIKDVEIKVVDEEGKRLPSGKTGKILIKGPTIMTGYWKEGDAAKEAVKNGWLDTGDLGFLDEDGYLFLAGRQKDIIIRGGENIAPVEIEAVIESHPKVIEAAVIGVPDQEWGEVVRAIVVPKGGAEITEEELIAFCDQKLAGYKRPASVIFTDFLPRNALGKVLKKDLKDLFGR